MKKYIVKPLNTGGYKSYELCADNYNLNSGEFLVEIEQFNHGYNNLQYQVNFIVDTEHVLINGWSFPKEIYLSTHVPGSYQSINCSFDVLGPDGLKLQLSFYDDENSLYNKECAINFIFSKLWITAIKDVENYEEYKGIQGYSSWKDEGLLKELHAVAKLKNLLCDYAYTGDTKKGEIDVKCYIEKEYNTRLERLLRKAYNKN